MLVNHDLVTYLERLILLWESRALTLLEGERTGDLKTVLEIGPGYGGLAYYLACIYPNSRFVLVDLPESLIFSGIYLAGIFGEGAVSMIQRPDDLTHPSRFERSRFTLVPSHFLSEMTSLPFRTDLAINTLSFSEMSEAQVSAYSRLISRSLAPSAVFFEQNLDNRNHGGILAESTIRKHFKFGRRLRSKTLRELCRGTAHLWSNHPTKLGTPRWSPAECLWWDTKISVKRWLSQTGFWS